MGGRGSSSNGDNPPVNPNDSNPTVPDPTEPDPNNPDPTNWTLEQLQDYLRTATDDDDNTNGLKKIRQWLDAHKEADTITLKDGYMTTPETFNHIKTSNGIDLLYAPGDEADASQTLLELMTGYDDLPNTLRDNIHRIVMTTQDSGDITASAGDADGNIIFYKGDPITTGTLAHEAAHNFAYKHWDENGEVPADSAYADTIASGEPPVSSYARTNLQEDFAEAVKMYAINPTQLQQIAPQRYAIIHRLMTDPDYYGY